MEWLKPPRRAVIKNVEPSQDSDDESPRLIRRSPLSPATKLCPRCLTPLNARGKLGGWLIPQDYFCSKCGYAGTVFLEGNQDFSTKAGS